MNSIHPTAVIGTGVRLGRDNVIGPYVVIGGGSTLGDRNWIGAGTVLGSPPEVRSHPHPLDWVNNSTDEGLTIGNDNVLREGVQVHAGWRAETILGDRLFIMNQCYIGHDGRIEDDVTLASSVVLAGHVSIGRGANLGLGTAVHQGRVVGAYAMIGMGSVVTRDFAPFALGYGTPARAHGVNEIGMSRAGFDDSDIAWAKSARGGTPSPRAAAEIEWFSDASTRA